MESGVIDSIEFGILSPDDIRGNSVVEIEYAEVYNKGVPKQGGLSDLRLGTIERQFRCQTCQSDIISCPGHFGHINLATPLFHIGFIKTTVKILGCVCFACSRLLSEPTLNIKRSSSKFKHIIECCKGTSECSYCEFKVDKLQVDHMTISILDLESAEKKELSAADVYYIFRKIPDEDILKMGFDPIRSHPKNMLISALAVPPPQVRPSITMDTVSKSQDDLTHKLSEIIKVNTSLKTSLESEAADYVIKEYLNLLQFHVNTYFDNEIPGQLQAVQRTGRPVKGICQRLKSKEGRVRNNLMGKRVDFSARTVITAEPNIYLDQLGVPHEIAKTLTFPETVTNFNVALLQEYVNNGPEPEYGKIGAKYIVAKDGTKRNLAYAKANHVELNVGDVVERQMKDGDVVVFNRQPTLHKMSMMAHKVKVLPHKTFRLNLSATSP